MYSDQALQVLKMVKHGYSDASYNIPPLDTFEILWGCDINTTGSYLSQDNIQSLVDQAISYLLELSSPKQLKISMGFSQSTRSSHTWLSKMSADQEATCTGGSIFWDTCIG